MDQQIALSEQLSGPGGQAALERGFGGDLSGEEEPTVASPHEVGKEGVNTPDAHMSPDVARKEGVTGVAVGEYTAIAVGVEVTGTAVDTGPEPEKDPLVDRLVADAVRTATKQAKERALMEEHLRRHSIRMLAGK